MASLDTAGKALAAGSWSQAAGAFQAVIDESDDPLAHEGLAQVAWWLDDAGTCLGERETAYRRHRQLGDPAGAGRAATALAWDCLLFGRGEAVARGWLGRARELLTQVEERAEHGWLCVREAELALAVRHDPVQGLECATRATDVGRRTGDDELAVVASALQGVALTASGEVEPGMARLDSAAAAVTAGDVADLMWAGKVLCWLIAACHDTRDVTRAEDWCRRVEALCLERDLVPLLNVCRIQYASVQVAGGSWAAAETTLTETVARLSSSSRASRLEAVVQLGELRRRQGRLDEAEALLAQAEFHPVAVLGRALIRLAAGERAAAWTAVRGLLTVLPEGDRLARADILLPVVRIAVAMGEREAALQAADELRAIATAVGTDALRAGSAVADSLVAAPGHACALLSRAVRSYHRAGLRQDEAMTRLLLAETLLADDDTTGSDEQVRAAIVLLEGLPDAAGLARAHRLARAVPHRSGHPLTPREVEVLRLVSRGLSNDEIATSLVISAHTVHRHVANILTKLEESTRTGAVSRALGAGII